MSTVRPSQKPRGAFLPRLAVMVLALAALYLVSGVWEVYRKALLARDQRNLAQQEVEELRLREMELRSKIEALNTERGLEKEIRERFDVAKEGERVVVIVDPDNNWRAKKTGEASWWQSIVEFFKH